MILWAAKCWYCASYIGLSGGDYFTIFAIFMCYNMLGNGQINPDCVIKDCGKYTPQIPFCSMLEIWLFV